MMTSSPLADLHAAQIRASDFEWQLIDAGMELAGLEAENAELRRRLEIAYENYRVYTQTTPGVYYVRELEDDCGDRHIVAEPLRTATLSVRERIAKRLVAICETKHLLEPAAERLQELIAEVSRDAALAEQDRARNGGTGVWLVPSRSSIIERLSVALVASGVARGQPLKPKPRKILKRKGKL